MKNLFLVYVLICSSLLSCSRPEKNRGHDFISDDIGNKISTSKQYKRIISLAPNITEIIYLIKSDSFLVGVTDFCDYPAEAKNKITIGGILNPNTEKIVELKPDIILMTSEGNSNLTYQNLKDLGFEIMVFNPTDFTSIISSIIKIGIITKNEEYSKIKTDSLTVIMNSITLSGDSNKHTAFVLISIVPLITVNKETFINTILYNSGLKNIYEEEKSPYPEISFEDLSSKKPNYYIIPVRDSASKQNIINFLSPKLNISNAELSRKSIIVNEDLLMRPGPRIIDAIDFLKSEISSMKLQ